MYIKLTNGIPEIYSIGMLRRDNPNISFPKNLNLPLLAEWNVYPCAESSVPDYDRLTHKVVDDKFEFINDEWILLKKIEVRSIEIAANNIRNERNSLLAACDWTQVADAPVNSLSWADYRQALRDITSQEGFPYNVIWPVKP